VGADRKSFAIDVQEAPDRCVVHVSGVVDENADLSRLASLGASRVEVNLKDVRRINSFGVRSWVEAMRKIPPTTQLEFVHCPPPVIDQCNMVNGFLGHGRPLSFYAMMVCEDCDEELDQLFETEACVKLGGQLPATPCPNCGSEMEIDDLEEQYLLFLREP
jgi:hypothetical protein